MIQTHPSVAMEAGTKLRKHSNLSKVGGPAPPAALGGGSIPNPKIALVFKDLRYSVSITGREGQSSHGGDSSPARLELLKVRAI